MVFKLFLLFTIIPLVELYVLIRIGSVIGAGNTILLVIITGLIGAYLARLEGVRVIRKIQRSMEEGRAPAEEMIDALLIFVAGVLLITPGVLTDLCGLLLLFPYSRQRFKVWLRRRIDKMIQRGTIRVYYE